MTFVNHTVGGYAIGYLLGGLLGASPAIRTAIAVANAVAGAFPDVADWALAKLGRIERWSLYAKCHPIPGGGQVDKWARFIPGWGLHTWVVDSVVHLNQRVFLIPQFEASWKDEKVIWGLTAWDIRYVGFELFLYWVYWSMLSI